MFYSVLLFLLQFQQEINSIMYIPDSVLIWCDVTLSCSSCVFMEQQSREMEDILYFMSLPKWIDTEENQLTHQLMLAGF